MSKALDSDCTLRELKLESAVLLQFHWQLKSVRAMEQRYDVVQPGHLFLSHGFMARISQE